MAKRNEVRITKPEGLTRTVEFQVDTIPESTGLAAFFSHVDNTITTNYLIDGDNEYNEYNQSAETLTHETKHKDNASKGIHAYALSPELAYKTDMHDEISANITELITLREKYIKTGDIKVFAAKPKFKFYADAIKSGKINPKSLIKEDFDKDMSLIANGTRDMWMKKFANGYIEQNSRNGASYGETDGKHAKFYKQNYERAKKIAYGNIGGVDFTKYMKGDVEIPKEAYFYMLKNNLQDKYKKFDTTMINSLNLPKYDGSMPLAEYKQLLQHELAVKEFLSSRSEKSSFKEFYSNFKTEIYTSGKRFYNDLMSAKDAQFWKKEYPNFEAFYKEYSVDHISFLQKEISEYIKSVNDKELDKIVEWQARTYAKRNKISVARENDYAFGDTMTGDSQNYLAAVKKIYGEAYSKEIMGASSSMISDRTWNIIADSNKSMLEKLSDRWHNDWQQVKRRYTCIKDDNGKEIQVGFLGKVKYKAAQIKESVVSFFYGDASEYNSNNPIHPINNKAPEYRKWKNEDGSRVSPVQKKQILDMNKEIIAKPQEYKKKAPHIEQPSSLTVAREPIPTKIKLKNDKTAQKKLKKNMLGATRKNSPTKNKAKNNKGKGAIVATKHTVQKATKLRTQSNSR